MGVRWIAVFLIALGLNAACFPQDGSAGRQDPNRGAGQGQAASRGEGRGFGRGMGMRSGVMGTVTEVAGDHITVKNEAGETWTVNYSVNTRFVKQPPRPAGAASPGPDSGRGEAEAGGEGRGMGFAGPPTPIQVTDIKVGDAIMAGGEINRDAKSVGAVGVMLIDPERAKQMRAMQDNYGKTWLMGRVTAINETRVTVEGGPDNAAHTFLADENTAFRRRREPITLSDIQVGDGVRVDGALKDGQFVATRVNVMGRPGEGGERQREGAPPQ